MNTGTDSAETPKLRRSFGLITLVAFGIGDILGAGIYGLVGNVARDAGNAVWLSFAVAFVVAALTGLSYAELGSRLPRSGGEARYAEAATKQKWLAALVGFLVLLSGLVSVSTVSHIFSGYLTSEGGLLPEFPSWVIRIVFLLGVAGITLWGIKASSVTNVICTLIEVAGLLVVVIVALPYFGKVDLLDFNPGGLREATEGIPVMAILAGGVLAFYAFIGFEDLANVAEEVKDAPRVLPRAIVIALLVAAVFYGLIAVAAVSVVPFDKLTDENANAPLLLVVKTAAPGFPVGLFSIIALFAVTNTALVNFVMGSRLLYGMSRRKLVPQLLGRLHKGRASPDAAVILILLVTLALSLILEKATLAGTTSLILLVVFFVVNISLAIIKFRKVPAEEGVLTVPTFVPILGAVSAVILALAVKPKALISFAILAPGGILIYLVYRFVTRRSG